MMTEAFVHNPFSYIQPLANVLKLVVMLVKIL